MEDGCEHCRQHHQTRTCNHVLVFDPTDDMEDYARSRGMDKVKQSNRWLQIWLDFILYALAFRDEGKVSQVHIMISALPNFDSDGFLDLNDADRKLEGNAQHGELRIAFASGWKNRRTGLNFHTY